VKLPGRIYSVGAGPLRTLIENKQPRLVLHGHHHQHAVNWIGATKVISLARFYPSSRAESAFIRLEL
jgi:Icc-related predicted phosphoesterase